MSTSVYQGLETSLQPQLNEPRTLRFKFVSSHPASFSESETKGQEENCQQVTHPDREGWSFFEDLYNSCKEDAKKEEGVYVHPSMEPSWPRLSERSLELCTETLGNETGAEIWESSIFSLSCCDPTPKKVETKPRQIKKPVPQDFPPPLTTISGSKSLQVKPCRENGKLKIEAVASERNGFRAERSNGRFRLSIVTDYAPSEEEEEEGEEQWEDMLEDEIEDEGHCQEGEDEEGVDRNDEIDNGQMGNENCPRPSRCKEGERDDIKLINWDPRLMAKS